MFPKDKEHHFPDQPKEKTEEVKKHIERIDRWEDEEDSDGGKRGMNRNQKKRPRIRGDFLWGGPWDGDDWDEDW